jgi:TolB protein
MMWKLGLALAAVVLAVGLTTAGAGATTPGTNGLLAYSAYDNLGQQLNTIAPDGSGDAQLTNTAADSLNANWSADGKRIVFERDAPSGVSVYTIRADGTGLRVVVRGKIGSRSVFNGAPAYSRNDKHIVFDRQVCFTDNCGGPRDHNALWLVNAKGKHPRRLTRPVANGPDGDHYYDHPEFSPDGKHLVYVFRRGAHGSAIFVAGADGKGAKQITPWSLGVAGRADWSPDGSLILFSSSTGQGPDNVYIVHPDGTGLDQVTHETSTSDDSLTWSPDGKQIMLLRGNGEGGNHMLYVMNADGSGMRNLTPNDDLVEGGSWGTHQP